eukprot:jgi/Botrbrau1/7476/Bobra.0095s0014.1
MAEIDRLLECMSALIKKGDIQQATREGNEHEPPMAMAKADLVYGAEVAKGAQSIVYGGTYNGREVAIKVARIRTSKDLEAFRTEVTLLVKLAHPGIVSLIGARMLPPDYLMVMPLEWRTLAQAVHESGWSPSWGEALHMGARLAQALAHVHSLGFQHRDIKPANILARTRWACEADRLRAGGTAPSARWERLRP